MFLVCMSSVCLLCEVLPICDGGVAEEPPAQRPRRDLPDMTHANIGDTVYYLAQAPDGRRFMLVDQTSRKAAYCGCDGEVVALKAKRDGTPVLACRDASHERWYLLPAKSNSCATSTIDLPPGTGSTTTFNSNGLSYPG